jgi:segregation and condensation protein B
MDNLTEILEAVIFTAGKGISKKEIGEKLPDVLPSEIENSLDELKQKYGNDSGVKLIRYNDKVQFSSNPKFGGVVSDILTPIKEKELSKTLLEVLAIVAYRQPVTRLDIEEVRGVSSEYAVAMLQKVDMITAVGTKDAVGRPTLFGTTEEFLKKFCLNSIEDLPLFDEVLARVQHIDENYNKSSESLYRDRHAENDDDEKESESTELTEESILKAVAEKILQDESVESESTNENILKAAAEQALKDESESTDQDEIELTEESILKAVAAAIDKEIEDELRASETPDFLEGEEFEVIE